ncbi:MAG: hypothetical protein OXB88_10130 [Bacteriovoracales bacterium]|nr:hypothetical protein [Bacteriovoracales bacterium]
MRLQSSGISLLEIMIGIGLSSGLVIMDLQRQKNVEITSKRKVSQESVSGLRNTLRDWLRQDEAIKNSFGMDSPTRIKIVGSDPTCATTNRDSTTNIADACAIRRIALPNGEVVLRSGTPSGSNVTLIGPPVGPPPPQGNLIRSLDQSGWTYIRAMWIENFRRDEDSLRLQDQSTGSTLELERGSADMKIIIWKFTNRIDNAQLDCSNNCIKETITLPLNLKRIKSIPQRGTLAPAIEAGHIQDGSFGLQCGERDIKEIHEQLCEDPNEFWNTERTINTATGANSSVGRLEGRCCRFVQ